MASACLKPVFHFKRTVPKRIKNVFKFQNFVNVDWLVLQSVVRQKVDLRRTFYFDTRIHPEVRKFKNLFSICACSPVRFATIRAKWKTGLTLTYDVFSCIGFLRHSYNVYRRPSVTDTTRTASG
jgi:hypothetical protein